MEDAMTSPLPSGALRRIVPALLAAGAVLPLHAHAADASTAGPQPLEAAPATDSSLGLQVATRTRTVRSEIRWLHRRTRHLSQTIRFEDVRNPRLRGDLRSLVRERRHWRKEYRPLRRIQQLSPRQRFKRWDAWMCIHRHEGSWSDPGAPYYGGLQMDTAFQRAYGGYLLATKGTANTWTPLEQVAVAERAYRTRGFAPWPNTARACGLL
jgi:hypothetical protein